MKESVLHFDCNGDALIGILAEPHGDAAKVGVVIVVGGPQYRAGSHRQFTRLARHLAAAGHAVLRFDVRGMGDSEGQAREFDAIEDDIAAAVNALSHRCASLKHIVLYGLCDGASAALIYCGSRNDFRVSGLVLQNPWFRSAQGEATALVRSYYAKRLASPEFWKKLLRGGVGLHALRGWIDNRRLASQAPQVADTFHTRMVRAWRSDDRPLLLQISSEDLTAQEFTMGFDLQLPAWKRRTALTCSTQPGADHTFSNAAHERRMQDEIHGWLQREFLT
ncbi:hydrolase 1, exosortase A system-associated [Roseateles sp. DC23W]|uniref:Hydrolase 1, exosortase A system-associated n=1 Tax=Pelomonas dachongensis TaxID=3299029 RepID=A0ABW7EVA7_9BURK